LWRREKVLPLKISIFWDITPCTPFEIQQPFRRNKQSLLATCFQTDFLLGLFFILEDGGDIFLRNVDWVSTDYTALYPRR
jgi:hypothetical protein